MDNDKKRDSKKRDDSKYKKKEKKKEEKGEEESKRKKKELWDKFREPFKRAKEDIEERKKLKRQQRLIILARIAILVVTLGGLVIHGIIEPSSEYMEIILDRGAIPAAFGSDMLLEFGMIICIFFHKWIHPAIATAIDATQIFLLACAILVVIETLLWVFRLVIAVLAAAAIALHIYLIIKDTISLKKYKKAARETLRLPTEDSVESSMYSAASYPPSSLSSASHRESPEPEIIELPPSLRRSISQRPSKDTPGRVYGKWMQEEEKKRKQTESLSAPARKFREKTERKSSPKATRPPSTSSKKAIGQESKSSGAQSKVSSASTQKAAPKKSTSSKTSQSKDSSQRESPHPSSSKGGSASKPSSQFI